MLKNVCERFHSECPPKEMKIGAVCHPRVSLIFTHIFGWTLGAKVRDSALSLGERVAIPQSRESRGRGYLVMLDPVTPPRRATDPSPGPRRLVKAPVAVHPLPLGEGKDPIPSFFSILRKHTSFYFLSSAFCLPLTGYCFLPTTLWSAAGPESGTCATSADCLLPSAFCFLPTAYFTGPIYSGRESR
jgi:hypothetical protein